jgi:DNA-directed RNA polymerase specialized sigma24 family protein
MQVTDSKDLPVNDDPLQRDLPHPLPRLWRFALRLTRNPSDAEDLVQRCCVRALERRLQFCPGSAMLSWLFSIMHSIWLNELRSGAARLGVPIGTVMSRLSRARLTLGERFMEGAKPQSQREMGT